MADKTLTPLTNAEIQAFCSQMSMILKSGISSTEGLSIMLDDARNTEEQKFLKTALDTLNMTGSLYEAMKATGACPDYFIYMIQIGEQTGTLDDVMNSLSDYYAKEDSLSQTIRTAVSYPLIMIIMMIAVILILITKVMPVFNQVFHQLGSDMTGISRGFLNMGIFLNNHVVISTAILIALVVLLFFLFRTSSGQKKLQSFARHFGVMRKLSEKIAARRFADGMALTLGSGLTPQNSLQLSLQLVEDSDFLTRLNACEDAVSAGDDLCDTLLKHHIFSGLYARMASIGAKTGAMDEVMRKISGCYEEEIDEQIDGLIAAIEPTLVIILSIIVGIILLSVMLPLVSIMAGF